MKQPSELTTKFMRKKLFTAAIIGLLAVSAISAQDEKSEKKEKKKKDSTPQLTVVEMQDVPPVVEGPVRQKPSNGSLFTDDAANASLLADFNARRVGDLVFVDVVESSTANVTSSAKRNRDSGTLGGIVTAAGALPVPGAGVAGTVAGALGTRKYEGNGTTQRNSNIRTRITARVIEVMPNGDMRIEARKLVKINKETEQVAMTGIVRRNDLAADNSIPTVSVGDLRVEFNGKGVASADSAPGWLFRFFDKISPF